MKLRTKIWCSFLCIVMIPIVLTLCCGSVFMEYQLKKIRSAYGVEIAATDVFPNTTRLFTRMSEQICDKFETEFRENPEILDDKTALNTFAGKMLNSSVGIVIEKDNQLYYSSDGVGANVLSAFERQENEEYLGVAKKVNGTESIMYNSFDVAFSDGTNGTAAIIIRVDNWLPEMKALMVNTMIALVVILIFTALCFTMWTYRSILRPVNVLKEAARKIKEGNLDFEIQANEKDEMGQLCITFEEMRKRLKESAEEKIKFDEENKVLLSNISHDLKTPLTAIKGYVEGIMDGVADTPERQNRYMKTIYNKANDMDRLIDELTFYSKIDTNRIPYNFSKINVCSYFNDCADELSIEMESKGVDFQYSNYLDESVVIIADPEQIRRVVNNIVSNSLKYFGNKKKNSIHLRVNDAGEFVHVELEDNGKGIAKKDLSLIFERFYRTDVSRNSSKGGSGIGLSIVKKIMEDHAGRIWATSREGIGTVMHLEFRKYQEELKHG